jgi:hypothetical protein
MTRRAEQPQRASARLVLPAIDAPSTALGRGAAPMFAATAAQLPASLVCPPGQPATSAATRTVCERPPPLA